MKTVAVFIVLTYVTIINAIPLYGQDRLGFGRGYGVDMENGMRPGNGMGYQNDMRPGMGFENDMRPRNGMRFENGMGFENDMRPGNGMRFENGMGFGNNMRPEYGGEFENGMGLENGMHRGPGLGEFGVGQFANGNEYGANQYNNGASGMESQAFQNTGGKNFHNIGSHHHHEKSIKEEENDESHNIGGSEGFNTGAQSGGGFRNYQNGASGYGNQFREGSKRVMI